MTQRSHFDKELENLHNELILMCSYVEQSIIGAVTALETDDKELARSIYEDDEKVDNMEKSIESKCLTLLMRQQPVARDLRTISTALKMVTDLERIADQSQDIAEIILQLPVGVKAEKMAIHIPLMGNIAVEMVKDSVRAFIHKDVKLAKKVVEQDDEVDGLFIKARDELVSEITTSSNKVNVAVDTMLIVKYLERIADHAVNIAEWVEFCETGIHKQTKII